MSGGNVEIIEQMFSAWNRGDYEVAREFFDPGIEVEAALGSDIDGAYSGLAGLGKLMRFWGAFGSFHSDVEKWIPVGDALVTLVHHHATGKQSGIDVEMSNWQVFEVQNGKIVRYRLYRTEAQALEAARLPE